MTRVFLGRMPIHPVTRAEALDRVASLVKARAGGTVFTPNVDHVVRAHEDPVFQGVYAAAQLSLVDGMPVLWACRLLGHQVPEKVSGADLLRPLAQRAARDGWRLYFFGSAPGVAERAAARLCREYPGLQVVGTAGPHVDLAAPPSTRLESVRRIRDARPDVVLVALGSPKAELWANEFRELLKPAVLIAVGAALDFVVGAQQRAPRWMQHAGLEWLHRLATNPRRLAGRYLLRGPRFAPIVARCLWDKRARQGRAGLRN